MNTTGKRDAELLDFCRSCEDVVMPIRNSDGTLRCPKCPFIFEGPPGIK